MLWYHVYHFHVSFAAPVVVKCDTILISNVICLIVNMFRLSNRAINLLNKSLKTSRLGVDNTSCVTVLRLPVQFLPASFYSNNKFEVVSEEFEKNRNEKQTSHVKTPLARLVLIEKEKSQNQLDEQDKSDSKKNKEKSWRNMKITLAIFGGSFALGGLYLFFELGRPKYEDGIEIRDEFSNKPFFSQYMLRALAELNYYGQLLKEPSRERLLPDLVNHPLYHPKYTLILEFTDVIVHPDWTYSTGWRFKKRPGLDNFLESINGIYEVVVYTAEQGMTVFPIVDAIDPKGLINYKLVRDATLFVKGKHLKDLEKLNRDLSKVIVVDWNDDCTNGHRENVLRIPRWNGSDDDMTLLHLTSFLLAISNSKIDDVREVLRTFLEHDDPIIEFNKRQKQLIERAEARAEEERNSVTRQSPLSRWKPSIFGKQV